MSPISKVSLLLLVLFICVGLSFAPVGAPWQRMVTRPCSDCHPPTVRKITASATLSASYCRSCHDTVRFRPPEMDAVKAHSTHVGGFPGIGSMERHPKIKNLLDPVTLDMDDCGACHARLSDAKCMDACHRGNVDPMPHVDEDKECTKCHGDLPRITPPHLTSMPEVSSHVTANLVCYSCHSKAKMDEYALATGVTTAIPSELCWQCHFTEYYAWIKGAHKDKTKNCTHTECHNPHNPYLGKVEIVKPVVLPYHIVAAIIVAIVGWIVAFFLWKRIRVKPAPPPTVPI